MPIIVVCPQCRKSYKVNDKFAGKSAPCPNCKNTLQVPTKAEEVMVHAPTEFAGGGRSRTGKLITEPIARTSARLEPVTVTAIAAAVLVVLVVTWAGGRFGLFHNMAAVIVGLVVVSPPLVIAAYAALRDEELEPYRGTALYIRSGICALVYVALWGVFSLLASRGIITGDLWNWAFVVPAFAAAGGLAAFASLDLDYGNAMLHYGFYLIATVLLRWVAGMKWVWDVA
jgi:uncharacterized protein YbaR (Trm112 family)